LDRFWQFFVRLAAGAIYGIQAQMGIVSRPIFYATKQVVRPSGRETTMIAGSERLFVRPASDPDAVDGAVRVRQYSRRQRFEIPAAVHLSGEARQSGMCRPNAGERREFTTRVAPRARRNTDA
jgi:hypothetical protein